MNKRNEYQDEGLKGNERIEDAILALQQEATQEQLAHALTVIRRRMKEGGQLIVAVEPDPAQAQMKLQTVRTPDGKIWWSAFTSFEEELKGADQVKSTFLSEIGRMFEAALTVPEIAGIIINPWNRTIMLDKHLIRIIMPDCKRNADACICFSGIPLTIQPYFRDPVIPIFFLLWILVNHCVCLSTEWELCRIIATFVKLTQQNFGF